MHCYSCEEILQKNSNNTQNPYGIYKGQEKKNNPEHTHEFIEIVFILSGFGTHVINGYSYDVSAGSCLLILPGEIHSFSGVFTYFNVYLTPDYLSSEIITEHNAFQILALTDFPNLQKTVAKTNSTLIFFQEETRKEIAFLLEKTLEEYQTKKTGYETAVSCYLTLFFNELYRQITFGETIKQDTDFHHFRILEYIDSHYNEKLTLNELAKRCYYQPKYFSKIFKKYYGISVSAYIQKLRLTHGKRLLTETDQPIKTIAREIGCSDSVAFYRYFKQEYGCSPAEFRKKHRETIKE